MAALDIAIVGPALPALRQHFDVNERTVAWVFNVFVLLNLVGVPFMTTLADAFGRRTIYVVDAVLFGLGSLIVALSPSMTVLLIGRGVQGLAASGIFPAASAVVGDVFPLERRGRALGILGAVFGVAFIIGPIVAGVLLPFGWSWLFLVNVPMAAVVAVTGWHFLPTSRPDERRSLDGWGIVTLGLLLAALSYGINRIDASTLVSSLVSLKVWPFLVVAVLLVPLFLYVERKAAHPLLRLQLLGNRQVVLASLLAAGAGLTEAAFIFFPELAVAAFGVTEGTASFMLLPLVVAVALASPVAGRVLDQVGSRAIILTGTAALTLGLGIIGGVPPTRTSFYGGSVLIGVGLACLLGSSLSYILLAESREAERTVAQGVITLFIGIGQLVGGALIGAVAASGPRGVTGYARAFLVIAGVGLVLTLLSLGLKSKRAERAQEAVTATVERP